MEAGSRVPGQGPNGMCLFSYRRDYKLHKVSPVKSRQPDRFVPNEENMDLLTTYRQDYNPYSVCRLAPVRPRDSNYPRGDKMECLPTYKGGRGLEGQAEGRAGRARAGGQGLCARPVRVGPGKRLPWATSGLQLVFVHRQRSAWL